MALLAENLDYTDKDFDALRSRLFNLISSVYPTWSDRNVANFGNMLIECFAFVGDVLGFYQDNQAAESRWSVARQRKNLIALAKLIGFTPEGAKAAQVDVTITARDTATGSSPIGSVTIPAGTFVFTAEVTDPVRFQLLSDAVIGAGADPPEDEVTAENSAPGSDAFTSTGLPNQSFALSSVPYLDDSLIVVADDGTYTEVSNLLSSTGTDKHFRVIVDETDRATVIFGNGVNGKIPVGNIAMTYKTGGGSAGSVEENTITQIPGTFTDSLSNPVTVTVTNAEASAGAQDRQGVEQIREAAPESIRVLERSVTREDFEIEARGVEGVARALMLTSDDDLSVPENAGYLYLIPEGGGSPSTAIKNEVAAIFAEDGEKPALLTFEVVVLDPVYLTINIRAVVYFNEDADLDSTSKTYVGAELQEELEAFFAIRNTDGTINDQIDFGFRYKDEEGDPSGELPLSDIYNVIRDNASVRKIGTKTSDFLLNGEHDDVTIAAREFPKLGTVTIINGVTSEIL